MPDPRAITLGLGLGLASTGCAQTSAAAD